MAHVEVALYAPPKVQEEFKKKLNDWRYETEGKRKGKIAPFVSEIKMYDIRIPENLVGEFLRDLRGITPEDALNHFIPGEHRHHDTKRKWLFKFIRLLYKIFYPFKPWKKAEGKRKYTLSKSWNTPIVLGCFEDCKPEDKLTGKKREVL